MRMGESESAREPRSGPLRVCVTGAECTGKTTLALGLARYYAAPLVREYSRDHFGAKLARGDASVHTADILKVIAEQARLEDQAAQWTGPVIVCDTDVFTTATWYGYMHQQRPEIDAIARERRRNGQGIDLYIVCSPDIPFEVDNVHTSEEIRNSMHPVFLERLKEEGLPFVVVSGKPAKRTAAAIKAVESLLARRASDRSARRLPV